MGFSTTANLPQRWHAAAGDGELRCGCSIGGLVTGKSLIQQMLSSALNFLTGGSGKTSLVGLQRIRALPETVCKIFLSDHLPKRGYHATFLAGSLPERFRTTALVPAPSLEALL